MRKHGRPRRKSRPPRWDELLILLLKLILFYSGLSGNGGHGA